MRKNVFTFAHFYAGSACPFIIILPASAKMRCTEPSTKFSAVPLPAAGEFEFMNLTERTWMSEKARSDFTRISIDYADSF